MSTYVIRRTLQAIPLLFIISIISYMLIEFAPGDPVNMYKSEMGQAGANLDEAKIEKMMGLDKPFYIRYYKWVKQVIMHGNLGNSFEDGRPVMTKIVERIPATMLLMGAAIILSFIIAIPIGIYAAVKKYSLFDYGSTIFSYLAYSIPEFWFALMLVLVFSINLDWLPASDMRSNFDSFDLWDRVSHLILPTLSLALGLIAYQSRFMRTSMLEVVRQDYIRTARAKGLPEKTVILKHALRNALLPIITIVTNRLPLLLGGTLIIENIFAWPGMGRLAVNAIFIRDYQVIMGTTMIAAVLVVVSNLIADILYAVVDPRIQFGKN